MEQSCEALRKPQTKSRVHKRHEQPHLEKQRRRMEKSPLPRALPASLQVSKLVQPIAHFACVAINLNSPSETFLGRTPWAKHNPAANCMTQDKNTMNIQMHQVIWIGLNKCTCPLLCSNLCMSNVCMPVCLPVCLPARLSVCIYVCTHLRICVFTYLRI